MESLQDLEYFHILIRKTNIVMMKFIRDILRENLEACRKTIKLARTYELKLILYESFPLNCQIVFSCLLVCSPSRIVTANAFRIIRIVYVVNTKPFLLVRTNKYTSQQLANIHYLKLLFIFSNTTKNVSKMNGTSK